MTASLYQSALSGSGGAASATASDGLLSRNTEDMRRQRVRVELHEVVAAAPGVMAARDEIVEHVARTRRAVEIDVACLRVPWVEVHADEDQVVALLLRVAKELIVVADVEAKAPVALQRGISMADRIQAGDELAQASRPVAIPALDLVLLGVEVLLAARLARFRLHQLE